MDIVVEIALVAVPGARMPVAHWNYPGLDEDEQRWVYEERMRQKKKHLKVAAGVEQARVARVVDQDPFATRNQQDQK